jgi:protein-disulfide isomerase
LSEPERRRRPRLIGVVILAAIALISLGVIAALSLDDGEDELIEISGASEVQTLVGGIRQLGNRLGREDAPVAVEVFNDLQCGKCAQWQLDVIDPLIEGPVRAGEVKLLFRHYSVDQDRATGVGGLGAVSAGLQDHQWQFVELFFRNQDIAEDQGVVTQGFLEQVANGILNLNVEQWQRDFNAEEIRDVLEEDELRAVDLRIPSDPAVLVSGPGGSELLVEAPSLEEVEAAIAQTS